jgi:hypothetical protein
MDNVTNIFTRLVSGEIDEDAAMVLLEVDMKISTTDYKHFFRKNGHIYYGPDGDDADNDVESALVRLFNTKHISYKLIKHSEEEEKNAINYIEENKKEGPLRFWYAIARSPSYCHLLNRNRHFMKNETWIMTATARTMALVHVDMLSRGEMNEAYMIKIRSLNDRYLKDTENLVKRVRPIFGGIKDIGITGSFVSYMLKPIRDNAFTPTYLYDPTDKLKFLFNNTRFGFESEFGVDFKKSYTIQIKREKGGVYIIEFHPSEDPVVTEVKDGRGVTITASVNKEYRYEKFGHHVNIDVAVFDIIPGTDIDVTVFGDEKKLDDVCEIIYQRVKGPGVIMEKIQKKYGYTWAISMKPEVPTGEDPLVYIKKYLSFYPIEIYISSPLGICRHHVPMTRGWLEYTEEDYIFHVEPSMFYSLVTRYMQYYNHVSGKKSTIADILLKAATRGYNVHPRDEYEETKFMKYIKEHGRIVPYGIVI